VLAEEGVLDVENEFAVREPASSRISPQSSRHSTSIELSVTAPARGTVRVLS
jgi:hypothetical protein